jgi:hypothetical protein
LRADQGLLEAILRILCRVGLMRHASISTTMGYYVDLDAGEVADQLWADYGNTPATGNTLGNIGPERVRNEGSPTVVSDHRASS